MLPIQDNTVDTSDNHNSLPSVYQATLIACRQNTAVYLGSGGACGAVTRMLPKALKGIFRVYQSRLFRRDNIIPLVCCHRDV